MGFAIAAAVGTGIAATAAAVQAREAATMKKAQYKLQADAANTNAAYTKMKATHEILAGQFQEQQIMMKGDQVKGAQIAALGASGIEMGSGTALDQLASTDLLKHIDAVNTRQNAEKQAWASRIQAQNYEQEGAGAQWTADQINPDQAALWAFIGETGRGMQSWGLV
jgi:hypothetical protein